MGPCLGRTFFVYSLHGPPCFSIKICSGRGSKIYENHRIGQPCATSLIDSDLRKVGPETTDLSHPVCQALPAWAAAFACSLSLYLDFYDVDRLQLLRIHLFEGNSRSSGSQCWDGDNRDHNHSIFQLEFATLVVLSAAGSIRKS